MARVPGTYSGRRALYALPTIPDHLEPELKNALAIRNQCAVDGVCPACHAVGEITPDDHHPLVYHFTFRHEPWCPCLRDDEAA